MFSTKFNIFSFVQCNSAMQIFAEMKQSGETLYSSPRSLAEAIVEVSE
jgi:hypothetical protein